MVSLERFDHFLHDMQARGVTVLLCGSSGVYQGDAESTLPEMASCGPCLPRRRREIFCTLKAVRHVYDLLEQNSCNHCGQNELAGTDRQPLYYLV